MSGKVVVSEPLSYPVPWRDVFGLWRNVKDGTRTDAARFLAGVARHIQPEPRIEGRLPEDPRFVLAANHYQRPGLWILHTAVALTRAVEARYGPSEAPVRWMVTANWPPLRIGPLRFPSPGDWLLPRVAYALHGYPVPFAGTNPRLAAATLRRLLRDAAQAGLPIGIFPEGVAGVAGRMAPPLPGVGRLLVRLGKPVLPAHVAEDGRFLIRFGDLIPAAELASAPDAGQLVLDRIADLSPQASAGSCR